MKKKPHYRAVFISDVHLGSRACRARALTNFLKSCTADEWYLIGDIIDAWKVLEKSWYWDEDHSRVIRALLKISLNSKLTYVTGNHDEFLRGLMLSGFSLENITLCNETSYETYDGKKYLVTHGDLYDSSIDIRWLSFLGDYAYGVLTYLNRNLNSLRKFFALKGRWAFSAYVKKKVKAATSFIVDFENRLLESARSQGYDGVICGHIHTPAIKWDCDGTPFYMNSGDWVENCTALVETVEGGFGIWWWEDDEEK